MRGDPISSWTRGDPLASKAEVFNQLRRIRFLIDNSLDCVNPLHRPSGGVGN